MNHDQNPHKLILLRGNSGSGKTTLAHMLQHKLGRGTLVISQDVIRRDMLWAKDTKDGPAVSLLINLVQYGRQHCDVGGRCGADFGRYTGAVNDGGT